MAKRTRAEITAFNNSSFPDNSSKQITEEVLRNFEEAINESFFNLLDDDASDIKVDDVSFTADNVLDALKEVRDNLSRPLFYVDVNYNSSSNIVSLVGTNWAGVSVTNYSGINSNAGFKITFPNTVTEFGAQVRSDG